MLVMHISGVFAPAVLDESEFSNTDYVIPALVLKYMNPVVAGLFIAAPLAAVMSTVSSLLILASAAIVKDLYLNYIAKPEQREKPAFNNKIKWMSIGTTFLIGAVVFLFTIYPPDLIVWINLFAMGGLECAFFCPILFGLYWKRANSTACVLSAVCGVISFVLMTSLNVTICGVTPIVPSILISMATFIVGGYIGKPVDRQTLNLFFLE